MKAVLRDRKTYMALVVVVLVVATVMAVAMAQPAPGQGEDGERQERQDRGNRGGRMFGGMMGMMGGSSMSVTDDAVFVLTGGMLLKYDIDTLELLAQAQIPRPEFRPRPDREQAPE